MGFAEKFLKSKKEKEASCDASFVMGVEDVFELKNSEDVVVVGQVKGTVNTGMAIYVSNIGDDNNVTLLSTVVGMEIRQQPVNTATDCSVAIRLEAGKKGNIKIGSVLFSREMSSKEVHSAYINAIGNAYVGMRKLELSDKEIENMSITDLAEAWRMFSWMKSQTGNVGTDEQKQADRDKVSRLADVLIQKILEAEEIFVVFNKKTGEPHLFSKTIDQQDGTYRCTPPDILVIPKAYESVYSVLYSQNDFELRKIENGEDKKGIYNFFGSTFYLNGACGIDLIGPQTAIDASKLVPPPDYSNTPQINIPVTNPGLVRWMLLLGQLGEEDSQDKKTISSLYFNFFLKELKNAMLLIPMKKDGEHGEPDENGQVILGKDMKIMFPTMHGKKDREAVRMYTDWKRLRMEYGEEWSGMVQPVKGMIDVFDCAINATKYPAMGCYVDREMFEICNNRED